MLRVKKHTARYCISIFCVILLLLLTSCSAVTNKLPNEDIVSVVRVTSNLNGGEETELVLSEEKISQFSEYISALKYKKYNNIFKVKTEIYDSVAYVITYDSYTVKLSEHHLIVYRDGVYESKISFSSIKPSDTFAEIDKLFE